MNRVQVERQNLSNEMQLILDLIVIDRDEQGVKKTKLSDALVAAGYKGVWTVEYEGRTDPLEGYRKGYEWVKANVPV